MDAVVVEDAFLQSCSTGGCLAQNFGVTEFYMLADAESEGASVLLLRLPVQSLSANQVDVTLSFFASKDFSEEAFTISAVPISAPCDWIPGPYDNQPLLGGDAGVTAQACDGDPKATVPWGEGGADVWDNVDPEWDAGTYAAADGDVAAGEGFLVTLTLDRAALGPTPEALLIASDIPYFDELFVYAAEAGDGDAPRVDIWSLCD